MRKYILHELEPTIAPCLHLNTFLNTVMSTYCLLNMWLTFKTAFKDITCKINNAVSSDGQSHLCAAVLVFPLGVIEVWPWILIGC